MSHSKLVLQPPETTWAATSSSRAQRGLVRTCCSSLVFLEGVEGWETNELASTSLLEPSFP